MNTALQELIKELEKFKKFPMVDQPTITAAIDFAKLRLEKEKEQIMNAFVAGDERGTKEIPFNCEQYYSQMYPEPQA